MKQALGFLLLSCLISVGARMLPESQDSDLEDTSSSVPASAAADGAAAGRRLLASAGDMTVGTRIVGGTQASPSRFPYVCSLRTAKGDHFCGGKPSSAGVGTWLAWLVHTFAAGMNVPCSPQPPNIPPLTARQARSFIPSSC